MGNTARLYRVITHKFAKKRRKMRTIATLTPIWGQEMFIGPHFDQISRLDKNIVLMEHEPCGQYDRDHGIAPTADFGELALQTYYPEVEIVQDYYRGEYGGAMYNPHLHRLADYDIVLRLDPDMIFLEKDWDRFIKFIRETDHDVYRVNFNKCSINYYITGSFDHGLKDAMEYDPLGFSPLKEFAGVLDYPDDNGVVIEWDDFIFHHFRGWNKPKSIPWNWFTFPNAIQALSDFGDEGNWLSCPDEVKNKMINWQIKLEKLKRSV